MSIISVSRFFFSAFFVGASSKLNTIQVNGYDLSFDVYGLHF